MAFPFAVLCATTGTPRVRRAPSHLLPRSLARSRSRACEAAGSRRQVCGRLVRVLVRAYPFVNKTRRVSPEYIRPAALEMKSVSDMLRPLHFVLFAAFATLAFAAATENEPPANVQSEVEPQPDANDLEADATYWGYGRPYRYYGGWGYGRGWGGWGGWGGWRGGYWGGRGWGGRGYGGWGGWGYWG